MRLALSVEYIAVSLALTTAFSPSFVVHKNGAAISRIAERNDALVGSRQQSHLHRGGKSSIRLEMMFDQLSSALTEVAQNFGGKQR